MTVTILVGDVRARLADLQDGSVDMCVTSPPYWGLRDYGVAGQIGLEATPEEFIAAMVEVFREVRRVLSDSGTCWINIGDSYAQGGNGGHSQPSKNGHGKFHGHDRSIRNDRAGVRRLAPAGLKPKDLVGIPWMLAFALRADGWYLRQEIIWHKANPMPESVTDRCTKAHEQVFLLSKSPVYYFNADAIAEPASLNTNARLPGNKKHTAGDIYAAGGDEKHRTKGGLVKYAAKVRKLAAEGSGTKNNGSFDEAMAVMPETRNKRSVWTLTSEPFSEAHFATFPTKLVEPCILAGCPEGGTVLDPFFGAGTTGLVADRLKRNCIGIELNPAYAAIAERRIRGDAGMFSDLAAAL